MRQLSQKVLCVRCIEKLKNNLYSFKSTRTTPLITSYSRDSCNSLMIMMTVTLDAPAHQEKKLATKPMEISDTQKYLRRKEQNALPSLQAAAHQVYEHCTPCWKNGDKFTSLPALITSGTCEEFSVINQKDHLLKRDLKTIGLLIKIMQQQHNRKKGKEHKSSIFCQNITHLLLFSFLPIPIAAEHLYRELLQRMA